MGNKKEIATIVDAKEFGLEKSKANQISEQFKPALIEQEALTDSYNNLIKSELTEESVKLADNLRKQLKSVRTKIERIRKSEKNFYLAGGKFVDAWAKKSVEPIVIMEEKMTEMSNHFKNLEKERIAKLQLEREGKLFSFEIFDAPFNLGEMEESVWKDYIAGVKSNFDIRKKAEKEAEKQRIADLKAEEERLAKEATEKKRIEDENKRLKAEVDRKNAEAEKEAKRVAKIAQDKEDKRLAELKKIKAEQDRKDKIAADKRAKEKAKQDALIEKARKEKEELEAKIQAKKDADAKAKADAEAEAKKKALAPDKDKLTEFANSLLEIKAPIINDTEMRKVAMHAIELLEKVNVYVLNNIK